jgi:hypothetical protein
VLHVQQVLNADAPLTPTRAVDDLKALDMALSIRGEVSGAQDVREQIRRAVQV